MFFELCRSHDLAGQLSDKCISSAQAYCQPHCWTDRQALARSDLSFIAQGGIKQQFKAAVPLVYSLLRGLVGTSSAEASKKYLLDEADAVGVWESANVALVLFPNADTVPELERLAKVEGRPLLIMNPQWQAGQVRAVSILDPMNLERFCAEFMEETASALCDEARIERRAL